MKDVVSRLDQNARWHWDNFEKRGWSVVTGTIEEITPETTWIRTSANERIAITIGNAEITKVAQKDDLIRVVRGPDPADTVQIYCPDTKQTFKKRPPFNTISKDQGFSSIAYLMTVVPLVGIAFAWVPLLHFLLSSFLNFNKLKSLLVTLTGALAYLVLNLALFLKFQNIELIWRIIVMFIGNIAIFTILIRWFDGRNDRAEASLAQVLQTHEN